MVSKEPVYGGRECRQRQYEHMGAEESSQGTHQLLHCPTSYVEQCAERVRLRTKKKRVILEC